MGMALCGSSYHTANQRAEDLQYNFPIDAFKCLTYLNYSRLSPSVVIIQKVVGRYLKISPAIYRHLKYSFLFNFFFYKYRYNVFGSVKILEYLIQTFEVQILTKIGQNHEYLQIILYESIILDFPQVWLTTIIKELERWPIKKTSILADKSFPFRIFLIKRLTGSLLRIVFYIRGTFIQQRTTPDAIFKQHINIVNTFNGSMIRCEQNNALPGFSSVMYQYMYDHELINHNQLAPVIDSDVQVERSRYSPLNFYNLPAEKCCEHTLWFLKITVIPYDTYKLMLMFGRNSSCLILSEWSCKDKIRSNSKIILNVTLRPAFELCPAVPEEPKQCSALKKKNDGHILVTSKTCKNDRNVITYIPVARLLSVIRTLHNNQSMEHSTFLTAELSSVISL
ncbi:hypothetical protein AGLY_004373, partial [Aphis glycines]